MVTAERESVVFRVDPKLLQHRPPRLTLAATLNTLGQRVESKELTANLVVDVLDENRLLPYIIRNIKNLHIVSLGQITNASKIGDIIVSEECIRGTYELCLAFLRFVLTIIKSEDYADTTKTMLASVTYIANEIYPNHHIWTYKNVADMYEILGLCTEIFYEIIVKSSDKHNLSPDEVLTLHKPVATAQQPSDLDIVCIINLSQNHAHRQLLDVIVEGKQSIKKVISDPEFKGEESLNDAPIVLRTRQSLSIFHKLLIRSEYIKNYYESQNIITEQHLDGATANYSNVPMTNIERALFDTSIRPGLLQHLFSYIYQKEDSTTACLAIDLIKKIAEKFSMSLMASLGSEADRVCEFFIDCLSSKESNMNLRIAIVDLLSTCVRHQPGLIELFLNFNRDTQTQGQDPNKQQLKSLQVIMDLLKECRAQETEMHRSLHTYVMKFILTFWQKCHSAIEQFDKVDDFWEQITHPLIQFLDSRDSIPSNETYTLKEALNEKLSSHALMILAREIYNVNAGTTERKMNPRLAERLNELASKNLLSKYSIFVIRRYSSISKNLDKCDFYNRILAGWRDFLASYSKYKPFEASPAIRSQVIENILSCLSVELRLGEKLDRERLAAIGETLLLTWTKWMSDNTSADSIFQAIHELLYLANSCRDYVPFSFMLTFQSTLNLYLMRNRDYLMSSKHSFDLLVPAAELMQFSLKIMEKFINHQDMQKDFQRHPGQGPQKMQNRQNSDDNQELGGNHAQQTRSPSQVGRNYKPGVESRLCQASIMTLRYIIDVARPYVDLWIGYLQTNLKTDYLVHFLTLLMTKRTGSDVCISMVELLLCLSSIEQTADYLNKRALISQVNIVAMSAYDGLLPNQAVAFFRRSVTTTSSEQSKTDKQRGTSVSNNLLSDAFEFTEAQRPGETFSKRKGSDEMDVDFGATTGDKISNENKTTTTTFSDTIDVEWLSIYRHVIRLNISMVLTLKNDYISTAVEFLALHRIRICELIELLRTRPRSINMEEVLQTVYLINLVLRHGCMWLKRNRHSYETISEEIAKTAYTLATSALPPPVTTETSGDPASSQTAQHTSLKPRDCLIYAWCCYDFGKYTEAERVLFQTKYGDKDGFIEEAANIYGTELSDYAFHLAALICLKTNRQGDAIDFGLQ